MAPARRVEAGGSAGGSLVMALCLSVVHLGREVRATQVYGATACWEAVVFINVFLGSRSVSA